MKVKVEFPNTEALINFNTAITRIEEKITLVGKDEKGNDWEMDAHSFLDSLFFVNTMQNKQRECTAQEIDYNTIWCCCEKDIYTTIEPYVVL